MGSPSVQSALGRVEGQQDMILRELTAAREDRKEHFVAIDDIRASVLVLGGRMTIVEETLTKFSPTIEEYISIKNKVLGAGRLGKWMWVILIGLIGLAAKFRVELMAWFAK